MALPLLGLTLALAALVIAVVLGAQAARRSGETTPVQAPSSDTALGARRHASVVRGLAWGALIVIGAATLRVVTGAVEGLAQGRLLGLVPIAAGIALIAVHAVGDLTWPRPTGAIRRATLARRTAADITPGPAYRLTVAWGAALATTLIACGAFSDDGRSLARAYDAGTRGAGPFPGWFYGAPLLIATLALLIAVHGLLILVARRPAVAGAPDAWDLELRRHSARAALGGAQLVLGLTLAAVLMLAGMATRNVGSSSGSSIDGQLVDAGSPLHTTLGIGLILLALVVALTSLVVAARSPQAVRTPAVAPA